MKRKRGLLVATIAAVLTALAGCAIPPPGVSSGSTPSPQVSVSVSASPVPVPVPGPTETIYTSSPSPTPEATSSEPSQEATDQPSNRPTEQPTDDIPVGTGSVVFVNFAYSETHDECVVEDIVFDVSENQVRGLHGVQFHDSDVDDDDQIGQDPYVGMHVGIVIPKDDYHPIILERGSEPFTMDDSDGCADRGSVPDHMYGEEFAKDLYYSAASWIPL